MIIMFAFLFVGERIITFIGVDVNSFAVAGSFVLFALAMEMILGVRLFKDDGTPQRWPLLCRLPFQLLRGRGQ